MNTITKKTIHAGLIVVFILGLAAGAQAEPQVKEDPKEKVKITTAQKAIQGEVTSIGLHYIAVVYGRNESKKAEYEILLPIDDSVELKRINNLKELKVGDTVSIDYEEENTAVEGGEGKTQLKTKTISFVKSAPQGLVSTEEE